MNIIGHTIGRDASDFNGKIESTNNTLAYITRALLLKSSQKKKLWYFSYQYEIWILRQTENVLCGGVHYLLWHGTRSSYEQIKILGVIFYIINGRATRNKLDDRSHQGYFIAYASTTGVHIY